MAFGRSYATGEIVFFSWPMTLESGSSPQAQPRPSPSAQRFPISATPPVGDSPPKPSPPPLAGVLSGQPSSMAEALVEEIVEEILLRLPPDDPASLLRAAVVCRQWCRVISAPGFRRMFAQRHRSAPMLGFLAYAYGKDERGRPCTVARFVPTTPFRPPRTDHRNRHAVDARHGRVLLTNSPDEDALEVWDPVTDELRQLPAPPGPPPMNWNAAVVCAGHGACGHQDCRRGPSLVVLLDGDAANVRVRVYSSDSAVWSEPTYGPPSLEYALEMTPAALAGNALYFLVYAGILEYNLATQSVSMIQIPLISLYDHVVLTTTVDGQLGFARLEDTKLCFWLIETHPEGGSVLSHVRSIELDTLLPIDVSIIDDYFLSFAHGVGVIYVGTPRAWFSIDLKSNRVREEESPDGRNFTVIPYMSFYTPVINTCIGVYWEVMAWGDGGGFQFLRLKYSVNKSLVHWDQLTKHLHTVQFSQHCSDQDAALYNLLPEDEEAAHLEPKPRARRRCSNRMIHPVQNSLRSRGFDRRS
ncbi:hypothetical protein U9M48_011485 [Paspalum notatum var. saurae]|uniref:F-box domain-containing protein n=1 Tax=Paspalum notatum var. saurae TaxID=547442 RepID=A0AAQ3SVR1_PASNO